MPLYSGLDEYTAPTREEYEMQAEQEAEWNATRELIVASAAQPPSTIVRAAVGDVTGAIVEYTRIQAALDASLPDCILKIQGKAFRKKNYWRAIATAFNLNLEIREEKLDETANGWGYLVVYRATAPNGRFSDGDGSCYASEKTDAMATVHNVRAHAHTRAMNRAISNLVGFGEVSAEEMPHDDSGRGSFQKPQVAAERSESRGARTSPRPASTPDEISEPQRKRLWAIWSKRWSEECPSGSAEAKEANLRNLLGRHGYESSKEIKRADYEAICDDVQKWQIPETAPSDAKWEAAP